MRYHVEESGRLLVSLRELRLVVERNLMLLGVPKGAWPAVRDLVVDAEALGLDALIWLDGETPGGWRSLTIVSEEGGEVTVDAGGAPAPFIAPAVLDLALAVFAEQGTAVVRVTGARHCGLLTALRAAGHRYGAELAVVPSGPGACSVTCRSRTAGPGKDTPATRAGGPHLVAGVRDGIDVDGALWWRLYHASNEALTADTELSRGHAGAVRGTEDPSSADIDPDYVVLGSA